MSTAGSVLNVNQKDRIRGAIWGQFVGDAAALGSHWVYDLNELKQLFPDGVEGFETPADDHYHSAKRPGDQTHYGDGALVLLETVADDPSFDPAEFGRRFVEVFRPGVYPGYLDKATQGTLANFERAQQEKPNGKFDFQAGADDDQLATPSRIAAVVARYWSRPDLLQMVARTTRVTQNNPTAIATTQAEAYLLRELITGEPLLSAVGKLKSSLDEFAGDLASGLRSSIQQAQDKTSADVVSVTLEFGQACPLPQSFPSALHAFLRHSSDFRAAILETLRAGGDNAGRAAVVGAWSGAYLGVDAIPLEWRTRLSNASRIADAIYRIVEG
jgi:ADP-ribosyl-[dinitrogen reductase] hydrolase